MANATLSPAQVSRRQALWLLGLITLAARLPLWLGSYGASFDLESYRRVAECMWQGRPLYGDAALQGRYPYLPAWALVLAALKGFSYLSGLKAELCFKLPALAGDFGITGLLFLMMERLSPLQMQGPLPAWAGRPFWAALAYAANPLSLLLGAGHGQFDSLPLFFILLAVWHFEFSQNSNADSLSALSLAAAIALKSWPLFLLPLFLKNLSGPVERRRFLLCSLLPPLLLTLPFLIQGGLAPFFSALSYSGSQALSLPEALRSCFYGAGASAENYLALASVFKMGALSCLALIFIFYSLSAWRFALLPGLALGVLTLYVFAPGLASQYLLWLLPFALLLPGPLALRHTALGLLMLLLFYAFLMPEVFLQLGTWAAPSLPPWCFLIWSALNLGLWIFFVNEWRALFRLCRGPKGRWDFD